jgi:hypothetical protein
MLPAVVVALGVVASAGSLLSPADAAPPAAAIARCESLAGRLGVAPKLKPVVADMCRRAPTFRRQVVRLAAQTALVVTVEPGLFPADGRVRAATAIARIDGGLRRAEVLVPSGDSLAVAELIGHEFEHILEQLDGVDLASWVGHSGVHRVGGHDDGPIETERARQVGRLVASEYAAAGAGTTTALRVR